MTSTDSYLFRAAELLAKAEAEPDPEKRTELENLGRAFLRLAEQARRNSETDVTYEPPDPKLNDTEKEP
jgi:hypothetical protein